MAMDQDERAVAGLHEGEEEQESVSVSSRAPNAGGHGAAGSDSEEGEDIEEALTEDSEGVAPAGNAGRGDASGSAQNEEHEAPEENPATTHFELRGFRPARCAIARATPPPSLRLLPLRSRKGANPTRWIIVEDAASACANTHDHDTTEVTSGPPSSASLMSASATSRSASLSVTGGAVHGARNEALGSTARRTESDTAVDKPSPGDQKSGTDAAAAAEASSSRRLPSRSRKQRRPDHFPSDPEEAASAARAKARRSSTALDRFLTSQVRASPPEWPSSVAPDGAGAQVQRGGDVSMTTASWGGPEDPDGSARVLAVVAILGASLALSVVSCALFYIVGQQAASGPCDSCQKK